jgi:periplasmic divalent cation tolerance protein
MLLPNALDAVLLYSTAPDGAVAENLARRLIEQKLAACVNIIPTMRSFYEWDGALQQANEVAMLIKTTRARYDDIQALFIAEHPYDTPCLLMLEIGCGNPEFLKWIQSQTR